MVGVLFHHQPENEFTLIVMGFAIPFSSQTGCPHSVLMHSKSPSLRKQDQHNASSITEGRNEKKGPRSLHTPRLWLNLCVAVWCLSVLGGKLCINYICFSIGTQEINQRLNSRPQLGSRWSIPLLNAKRSCIIRDQRVSEIAPEVFSHDTEFIPSFCGMCNSTSCLLFFQ